MSTRIEQAVENHKNGFNCSQAVLDHYCEQLGLDRKTAFKIAAGFGNGMRMGKVCGAVTVAWYPHAAQTLRPRLLGQYAWSWQRGHAKPSG